MPRILIVDDDTSVSAALKTCLEHKGFEVIVADGGSKGLIELERTAFDLIVVDIFMPHMDGFESIRVFRSQAPGVPLIAMSGHASSHLNSAAPDFLKMALPLGASRCLRKPFTSLALLTAIDECLSEGKSNFQEIAETGAPPHQPDEVRLSLA
jgi:CheY-like chemotaxis protein